MESSNPHRPWRAHTAVHRKKVYIGYFASRLEAARARRDFLAQQPEPEVEPQWPLEKMLDADEVALVMPGDELLERSEKAASGFKGVQHNPLSKLNPWRATAGTTSLGYHATPIEAARARRDYLAQCPEQQEEEEEEEEEEVVQAMPGDELLERSDKAAD